MNSRLIFSEVRSRARGLALALVLCSAAPALVGPAHAQPGDDAIIDAREALRKKDRSKLVAARAAATEQQHPLTMWVDYWDLSDRLSDARQDELNDFYARWPGTYVEDRLRNDWLLELGRRRDWGNFAAEMPRFRMNDDREVTCYALLVDHESGNDVRDKALANWFEQRDTDEGCAMLAAALYDTKRIAPADVWRKVRLAIEYNRPRTARQAAVLISVAAANQVNELAGKPARYLSRKGGAASRQEAELTALALMRLAGSDAEAAARQLGDRWDAVLPADLAVATWLVVAKQAALQLHAQASEYFQRAQQRASRAAVTLDWTDDTLAWKVRAALRGANGVPRWQEVLEGIAAMSAAEQRDSGWVYWKARALQASAGEASSGDSARAAAQRLLQSIAGQLSFYGGLAAENLGQPVTLPARPAPLTDAEREAAMRQPGLARALQLIELGIRPEGVREWNFSLRGMGDRQLLAAAQLACGREVWDRCINTSDRTRSVVDMEQRFPTPFRAEVQAHSLEAGLDAAYVFGLIRQESRFVVDAKSTVGAMGLMQIMPATARWTARKIGLANYNAALIAERNTNLMLGTSYLKHVLEEFGGSLAMAAAAYNAGPVRSRKWREGPVLEAAVWAENIPFSETRDYVKKVLSNSAFYTAMMSERPASLRERLGETIGPRLAEAPPPNLDLP
ncbi:MAG: transglycosylase SLT domain-containing protein [Burkholderiaceae bacterium]